MFVWLFYFCKVCNIKGPRRGFYLTYYFVSIIYSILMSMFVPSDFLNQPKRKETKKKKAKENKNFSLFSKINISNFVWIINLLNTVAVTELLLMWWLTDRKTKRLTDSEAGVWTGCWVLCVCVIVLSFVSLSWGLYGLESAWNDGLLMALTVLTWCV